jgi:hypothetical protein
MNGQAIAARSAAVASLIEAHKDEFGTALADERKKRGLAEVAGGESTKKLEDRLAKIKEREAKVMAELEKRGVKQS